MTEIQCLTEIPVFQTEDEERAYWDTHSFCQELLDAFADGPGDPRLPLPRKAPHYDHTISPVDTTETTPESG